MGDAARDSHPIEVYAQLCESYRAVDSIRLQLLGALPLATGAGTYLLLDKDRSALMQQYASYIGLFGALITGGLFLLEIYGIRKCTALILTGKHLEYELNTFGQFSTRPISILNEAFAAGVIYPTVLSAWVFVALYNCRTIAVWAALGVFGVGLAGSIVYLRRLRNWSPPELPK